MILPVAKALPANTMFLLVQWVWWVISLLPDPPLRSEPEPEVGCDPCAYADDSAGGAEAGPWGNWKGRINARAKPQSERR